MEEKQYDYKGTVTISTEEYRDLLKSSILNEQEASEYRSKFWSCERERDSLKKKVKAQEEAIALYRNFVNSSDDRLQAYKLFLADRSNAEI